MSSTTSDMTLALAKPRVMIYNGHKQSSIIARLDAFESAYGALTPKMASWLLSATGNWFPATIIALLLDRGALPPRYYANPRVKSEMHRSAVSRATVICGIKLPSNPTFDDKTTVWGRLETLIASEQFSDSLFPDGNFPSEWDYAFKTCFEWEHEFEPGYDL